jgi:L-fuconolactonase
MSAKVIFRVGGGRGARIVTPVVDTHQHFWNLDRTAYPWLTPDDYGPINRSFEADELAPQLDQAGVQYTVVVHAANSYEDTEYLLEVADNYDFVAGVVGWVPLLHPEEAAEALDRFKRHPKFKGVRHLIHDEPDPDWLLQDVVADGLRVLADKDVTFDVVSVLPRHLEHVPTIAERVPELKLVIDHLSKPPIKERQWEPWSPLFARAAEYPNVYAKVSGLNTAADPENWSAQDLKPYIDFAIEHFGPERLMFGSDWPVATLAGDYRKVWEETNRAISDLDDKGRGALLGGTGAAFYGLAI